MKRSKFAIFSAVTLAIGGGLCVLALLQQIFNIFGK
jgi:hypothetical protein